MSGRARDKLTSSVTVKCHERLAAELERVQLERERELGVPLSRSLVVRQLLEECLGLVEAPKPRPSSRARV